MEDISLAMNLSSPGEIAISCVVLGCVHYAG